MRDEPRLWGSGDADEWTVVQDAHLQTVVEVLQSIKASEMTPMLQRIYGSEGGSELLDVLMKYLYVLTATPASSKLSVYRPIDVMTADHVTGRLQVQGYGGNFCLQRPSNSHQVHDAPADRRLQPGRSATGCGERVSWCGYECVAELA